MPGFEQTTQPPGTGRVLGGRYRLVAPIARGGMAEVWEGHDEVLSRPVAVKVLQSHLAADGVFLERFRREAVTAARLAHPCVVATFDTGLDQGTAFIVMELVRGRNLRQLLNDYGRLEPWQAVAVARQVADALAYAHQAGLVHRDIKPANVLLVEDEWGGLRIKVTDFGIAKAGQEAGGDLTRTGMVLGTPKYLSPEQIRGRDPDARTDLYSLGVVLYEMLVGQPPFVGETDMATALAHLSEKITKPSALVRGIPGALDRIVCDLLAKSPDRRIQSAAELRVRLDELGLGPAGGSGRNTRRRRDRSDSTAGTPVFPPTDTGGSGTRVLPHGGGRAPVSQGWGEVGAAGAAAAGAGAVGAGAGAGGVWRPGESTQAFSPPPPPPPGPSGVAGWGGAGSASGESSDRTAVAASVPERNGPPTVGAPAGYGPSSYGTETSSAGPVNGGGRPRARGERRAGLVVLALVVIGAVVAAVLLIDRNHGAKGATTPTSTSATSAPVPISNVTVWMLNNRPPDNPAQTPLTHDGNPSTFWQTDHYTSPTFGNLYPGMGLAITLGSAATLHDLTVTSTTTGWAASVYVSTSEPASGEPVSAWGQPTDTKSNIAGSATFSLGGRKGQYVLLWITNLGPADTAKVAELSVK